ncbi:MAG: bifunctional proline dehydrogenase/L-glutamate gamma-semialdehyde dehydrogenase [Microbacterium sp.]|jgi:RHH-type proline utilization regulon transcriptional repressor/proline dehydrogenase/delta 1-pyrroline-5-carboxylate dehydrogenase|uniref:bifunctional proline dehydrogenase/L-glutamate gamma-semialdehyde dehydrogenase n=1 Tax=Microbacterium sp. TaxID=51671 RepID=UPI0028355000|nr:bifunctional proline dehydrogenase/L-glutamate gamma-semialdehyde dehydrogenase [Microbacterium sp.]MDR2322705.1 bifunctional proline dehydrogenase/L-glutamate gamma-semialdehyde dehydrogenase [Microbacterium sp.]
MPQWLNAAETERARRAVVLAQRWIDEAAAAHADPAAERLAGVLRDPNGLPFTLGFVDDVMRPESLGAAAAGLNRVAPLVPGFLPWYLRAAVRAGGIVAQGLPAPTVPIARTVLREMVGHLIADARPAKLTPTIAKLRSGGARLNLNLLGEAVLGEDEAQRRLDGIHELIRRDDVDYVSVKVSAVVSRISMWAFDEVVEQVAERLLPLYLTAAGDPWASTSPKSAQTFINLDMEEYRDLDLTIAVFTRILEDPRLKDLEAGIVLQAYLPDALPALQELTAWAKDRVDHGGAPIKVRLVKGANLAMERVEAALHGWTPAPYDTKIDTDANYLRCLDEALTPESVRAVRIGIAGHNLFDIAYAWLLAGDRGVRASVPELVEGAGAAGAGSGSAPIEFEMLLGMAQGQVEAVGREVGHVLLYVPVVKPREFDVAISYLVRRLEETASPENFLSSAFRLHEDPDALDREINRFALSLERSADPALPARPRRRQNRLAPVHESAALTTDPDAESAALTQAVLGIAEAVDPGDTFVETAVFAAREDESAIAAGAPGFRNAVDSDPALPANREWAREILARIPGSTTGDGIVRSARVTDAEQLDRILARVRTAAASWGARPAVERGEVLLRIAAVLESRRAELIEVAAAETGKVISEGDVEVSEAVDFARYYAAKARELDAIPGAAFVPSRLTVVAPPWNFPLSIPAGGVLAALAAGSGVVFKPAPQARRSAAVIAAALWDAGIPRDLLAFVDISEGELGRELIAHPDVDRVILTGSFETAALFRGWRHDLALHAETSGKNAIVIAPSADLDLAVADLVKSAFAHAGQKCSAASLAILVGPVGRSRRFARQLVDAARSMRVAWPEDPRAEVGPVIEPPQGKLEWALTELGPDEKWLLKPREIPGSEGRLWTPGIRLGVQPGSRFHREEFFGPVLGIMHAPTLARAVDLQNAVDYGLTAGLHTQDPADLALWLDRVQAGNLYVNRGITGAIVQRQPFGGWKRSSVGTGTKAGGPNHLIGLGSWRDTGGAGSTTLHLRGLDSRITALIEAAQPSLDYTAFEWLRRAALSDALAWDREFGRVRDVSRLGVERNLFRYRSVPVAVRATGEAPLRALLRVAIAAIRGGGAFTLSSPIGLPAAVRRVLGEAGVTVFVESDADWTQRFTGSAADGSVRDGSDLLLSQDPPENRKESGRDRDGSGREPAVEGAPARPDRVRIVGGAEEVAALHAALAEAVQGDPDLAIFAGEVTTAGRIELLPFLHEQAIAITAHRYGNPDDWSAEVI